MASVPMRGNRVVAGFLLMPALLLLAGRACAQASSDRLSESDVLSRMDEAARQVKSVSASLDYTTVTVLVNDRVTEHGFLYYRKGRRPKVLVRFSAPDIKIILFKRNTAEIYYPKINQIQEYNLERHENLLQKFLLLGFGTRTQQLESSYKIHFVGLEQLGNQATSLLELTPSDPAVAAQLKKVDLWISHQNWLPVQQQFFEASGDYLIAHYSDLKVNHYLAPSIFKIRAAPGVERVKMN